MGGITGAALTAYDSGSCSVGSAALRVLGGLGTGVGSGSWLEEGTFHAGLRGGERVDEIAPDPRGSSGGLIEVVMISCPRILLYSLVSTVECGVAVGGALSVNVKWIQNGE